MRLPFTATLAMSILLASKCGLVAASSNLFEERGFDSYELSERGLVFEADEMDFFGRSDSVMHGGDLAILARDHLHDSLMLYHRTLEEYEDALQGRNTLVKFKIREPSGGTYRFAAYAEVATWKSVKDNLHQGRYPKIPVADMHLNLDGKEMSDTTKLADSGLTENSIVDLVVTMRAGHPGEVLQSTKATAKGNAKKDQSGGKKGGRGLTSKKGGKK
ncbi:hypothetical protein DFP72DRAFT_847996 [Ephemerocybe angulata]|uniref:Ubiquitin-like domain-containing protein n=1 Tax=Ephemerocybe angulata TaxID=980116 RepID=A0A8H6M8G3_9AGAR|nr:hypothetical protein DFP72DRAFT_847996 [Tulosesus angulatus]